MGNDTLEIRAGSRAYVLMEPDEILRQITSRQHGYAAINQLTAAGITSSFVRNRLSSGILERVSLQVVRLAGAPNVVEGPSMAAVLDGPRGCVLSHTAAAGLWRIPGFRFDRDLHVVVAARGQPPRRRLGRVHYHLDLPPEELMSYRGVPVTSPSLTMFHLAAVCSPDRVARALDTAWAEGLLTGPQMMALLMRLGRSGRKGITTIRQVMAERGPGYVPAASGLERRFQSLVDMAPDIPPMRRQVDLGGDMWVGRIDFVWDDLPGGVEVQSQRFHASYLDRLRDSQRLQRFEEAGLEVIEVWDTDVFHDPMGVVQRLRDFRWRLEAADSRRPA